MTIIEMEKFQELRELSKKKVAIADHILTQTYPLIKDAKLLLAVIENIFLALSYSMSSLLHHERYIKRIPVFSDNFTSKFNLFITKCVPMYNFKKDYILLIQNIKEILVAHKKSPVEFLRKDRFVICGDNYNLTTISYEQTKNYLSLTKLFVNQIDNIISRESNLQPKNASL